MNCGSPVGASAAAVQAGTGQAMIRYMSERPEFEAVGHCGGRVTIRVLTDERGRRGYQVTWSHCRPVPAVMFCVWALPSGIPFCLAELGGIGSPVKVPPVPGGVFQVFVSSDSEGLFGRCCPACNGYWRASVRDPQFCPYCGVSAPTLNFLTPGQVSYVAQFCAKMREVLESDVDGEHVIDMDAVADAAGRETEKPPFYYAEESQQNRFTCAECGEVNDILGRFGYCSVCSTWNGLQELTEKVVPGLRARINSGGPHESYVRDAVSEFDSLVGGYVVELVRRVGMSSARKNRLSKRTFQNLKSAVADLREAMDIDLLEGISVDDMEFAGLMFHRRHVYEHKGGVVDEKYIADSGDKSVRLGQALHESAESAHRIVNLIVRMARNLHRGFHEIVPPNEEAIRFHKRLSNRAGSSGGAGAG